MPDYSPDTVVKVMTNVPLDNTYTDTLKFLSPAAQQAYFNGKVKYTFTDMTYQRVNSSVAQPRGPLTVRVPQVADNLYDCNYLMFQNSNYGTKWFYAFIKQVNYISPENTEIVYELDHYQTWAFDYSVIPSMVLREHVSSDEPFEWLAPEPVEIYGYSINPNSFWDGTTNISKYIVITISEDASWDTHGGQVVNAGLVGGVFQGIGAYVFPATSAGAQNAYLFIHDADEAGKGDAVAGVFMTVNNPASPSPNGSISTTLPKENSTFFSYGPIKNNKLMSHPYRYLMVTSSDGDSQTFKPQYVNTSMLGGIQVLTPTLGSSMSFLPAYEGISPNYNRSVKFSEVPMCSWKNDIYANWEEQNSLKNGLSAISSAISMVAGIALTATGAGTMTGLGLIANGALSLGNLGAEAGKQAIVPDKASGSYLNSNLSWYLDKVGFMGYEFQITAENAEYIDNYFEMYGYQVNMLKVPNETGRESWNYVKTQNVILNGSIPVESMDRIKKMYNDGVRFWHGDYVGDYSRSNRIVKVVK